MNIFEQLRTKLKRGYKVKDYYPHAIKAKKQGINLELHKSVTKSGRYEMIRTGA